ncbi:transcriptional regulator [Streptomyces abyssalis]|uniref:Transcriptional regulator n=1 Tax=Streptomyces abyssalis TaxID=933944 RepID=A0A1E7JQM5_9ACTN|nr:transcriptional regulator [Streptomyces abyssalis]OEU95326.1 transcriptional regulator [Streptomyces abyssalis]
MSDDAERDAEEPLPGRRVRGSRTGRPIMAAFDLLGRRWTLRILWELRHGAVGFRALQQQCDDISPTVLNRRLREMRTAGLLEQDEARAHGLTPLAHDLIGALTPLQTWAERWAEARSADQAEDRPEGRRGAD